MTSIITKFILLFLLAIGILVLWTSTMPNLVSGSAVPGTPAAMATSSNVVMPVNTAVTLAATSTCAARIVTTSGVGSVMLLFSDKVGNTLTGSYGTAFQAASTTVVYDSGQYGCDLVRGFSYLAQTISISESR